MACSLRSANAELEAYLKKLHEQNEALEQNRILKEQLVSCQIRVKELEEALAQSFCLLEVSYLLFQQ
jgi:hypothetical protein